MPIPTYTPGYPPDGSSLGQTKATIRNNLDGTFQTLNVDHINNNGQPGSQPAGYHTVIHEVPQTSVSTVTGYNQIFSGVPGTLSVNGTPTKAIPNNGDTQLYALTGAGVLAQLTGYSFTTPSGPFFQSKGFAWIGGILLQWGSDYSTNTGSGNPITFSTPFPNNVFSITCTVYGSGSNARQVSEVGFASLTGFSAFGTNSTNLIYYLAVGN
jgi:hypothetical protein